VVEAFIGRFKETRDNPLAFGRVSGPLDWACKSRGHSKHQKNSNRCAAKPHHTFLSISVRKQTRLAYHNSYKAFGLIACKLDSATLN
jgi:hypothetical protein